MKILFVSPSYKPAFVYGGPTVSVSELAEALASAGHAVTVYTTTANGKEELDVPRGKPLDVNGVQVYYFSRQTGDHTHISYSLWKKVWRTANKFDIINLQSWWSLLILGTAFICRAKKKEYIVSPRGMLSAYSFTTQHNLTKKWLHKLFGKRLLKSSYLHATTELEWEDCIIVNEKWNGFILPNIVRIPNCCSDQLPLIRNFDGPLVLGFLSRIDPKKGIEILFHALAKVEFEFQLKIAGTGDDEYLSKLKSLAVDLRLDSRIEWCGWMNGNEKFEFLASIDLFILTSFNENFANAVIESLAIGTPVLISKKVGLAQYVEKRKVGYVCDLDYKDIRDKLIEIEINREGLRKIHQNSPRIVKSDFNKNHIALEYVNAYKRLGLTTAANNLKGKLLV